MFRQITHRRYKYWDREWTMNKRSSQPKSDTRAVKMFKTTVALVAVMMVGVAMVAGEKKSFEHYKVFRVTPRNEEQTLFLHHISEMSDQYSFWNGPSYTNVSADLMVAPEKVASFEEFMQATETRYEIFVENVQALIDGENSMRSRVGPSVRGDFDWTSYHTLPEIYAYLEKMAETYPDKVEMIVGGKSHEGRLIKGVKLSFKKNNPGVFIEAGIHAREWITPATVTYILNEFLTSQDPEVRQLAESNDWYIFPVFNPDGFVYTHTNNRLWRKTRKPYGVCHGSDPNRNWGYKWMEGGSSSNACAETYAGTAAFSDIETKSLSEYITSISDKIYAYIAFHSYSQLLLFPYGHTTKHLDNYDDMYAVGKKTIEALAERYGTRYVTGNIAETIYIATGSSLDWAKATFKFPLAYTYELRDKGRHGFLLPAEQIVPTGEETLDSLVGLFKEAALRGIPERG